MHMQTIGFMYNILEYCSACYTEIAGRYPIRQAIESQYRKPNVCYIYENKYRWR